MELIALFVQIKIWIIYNMIFIKIKIFITVEMIMLKDRLWNVFEEGEKLRFFHVIQTG